MVAETRGLGDLARALTRAALPAGCTDLRITAITADSRAVGPGALFVAVPGSVRDGHAFIPDAVRRGAAAVVVERGGAGEAGIPVLRVPDSRVALAELAAAWHGRVHERLSLVGITGTVGKTTVLSMLEAILLEAGQDLGTIGSLGVRIGSDERRHMGYTAPDPLLLHAALARIAEAGCTRAAMEVTSHALDQRRAHGLAFQLGIVTGILPLEHSEYHVSFRDYVSTKRSFLDLLVPGALLVYDADDFVTRELVRGRGIERVSCGLAPRAAVHIERPVHDAERTELVLVMRAPLPRLGAAPLRPLRLRLRLRLLGRAGVKNAALAATAALCLGAAPEVVRQALERLVPPRRRVQVLHRGRFTVIDDTVGHPDSISTVLEVAERLTSGTVIIAFAVRGSRGVRINRANGEALVAWSQRLPVSLVVATRSEEAADARNRVSDEEYAAFVEPLRRSAVPLREEARLDDAVRAALDHAGEGDVVLLLGAQGMDGGQDVARQWLEERRPRPA